jgi:hypothetical protein
LRSQRNRVLHPELTEGLHALLFRCRLSVLCRLSDRSCRSLLLLSNASSVLELGHELCQVRGDVKLCGRVWSVRCWARRREDVRSCVVSTPLGKAT